MKIIVLANFIIFLLKFCKAEKFIHHLEASLDVRHCLVIIASENVDHEALNIQDLKSPNILLSLIDNKGLKEASKTCKKHLILLRYQSSVLVYQVLFSQMILW